MWVVLGWVALPVLIAGAVAALGPAAVVLGVAVIVALLVVLRPNATVQAFALCFLVATVGITWLSFRGPGGLTLSDFSLVAAAMVAAALISRDGVPPAARRALGPLVAFGLLLLAGGLVGGAFSGGLATGAADAGRFVVSITTSIVVATVLASHRSLIPTFYAIYAGGAALSVVYAVVAEGGPGRPSGLSVHPNHFAMAAMLGLFAGAAAIGRGSRLRATLMIACSFICAVGVLISGSRAALIGTIVGGAFLLVLRSSRTLPVLAITALLCVGAVAITSQDSTGSDALSRLLRPGQTVGLSNADRSEKLEIALNQISGHAITGIGFTEARTAHSLALQLLVTGGVLGLLALVAFIWFLSRVIRTAWRAPRRRRPTMEVTATAGLVAAATTLVVQNNLWDRYLLVYLAVTAVAMTGAPRRERTASVDGPDRGTASGPEPARRSATS
ncbi:MAG: O-antigen ligase family protein [Microthrixaceae bacterium]